jgi:putative DNA primase/helicase
METKPKNIREHARGSWRTLLPEFGIPLRFLTGKHCPCPMCGGVDRFRFDNKEGLGSYFCSNCGAGDGFTLAQAVSSKSFKDICDMIRTKVSDQTVEAPDNREAMTPEQHRQRLKTIWEATEAVSCNDPVHRYLLSRGITQWPSNSFRIAKSFWHPEEKIAIPAMIAKVASPEGRAINLHVTYLTPDGKKAHVKPSKRVMSGKLLDGCAIRLGSAASVMGIAEGIETALAASIIHKMPVWSSINATMLAKWQPPDECVGVVIFGDNDKSYTGAAKSFELARKLVAIGYLVKVKIPKNPGSDWADYLAESIS